MIDPTLLSYSNSPSESVSFYANQGAGKQSPSAIASQFEAMFYRILFEQMRSEDSEDPLLSSSQGQQVQSMWHDELASHLASKGELGIKGLIEKELARHEGQSEAALGLLKE